MLAPGGKVKKRCLRNNPGAWVEVPFQSLLSKQGPPCGGGPLGPKPVFLSTYSGQVLSARLPLQILTLCLSNVHHSSILMFETPDGHPFSPSHILSERPPSQCSLVARTTGQLNVPTCSPLKWVPSLSSSDTSLQNMRFIPLFLPKRDPSPGISLQTPGWPWAMYRLICPVLLASPQPHFYIFFRGHFCS